MTRLKSARLPLWVRMISACVVASLASQGHASASGDSHADGRPAAPLVETTLALDFGTKQRSEFASIHLAALRAKEGAEKTEVAADPRRLPKEVWDAYSKLLHPAPNQPAPALTITVGEDVYTLVVSTKTSRSGEQGVTIRRVAIFRESTHSVDAPSLDALAADALRAPRISSNLAATLAAAAAANEGGEKSEVAADRGALPGSVWETYSRLSRPSAKPPSPPSPITVGDEVYTFSVKRSEDGGPARVAIYKQSPHSHRPPSSAPPVAVAVRSPVTPPAPAARGPVVVASEPAAAAPPAKVASVVAPAPSSDNPYDGTEKLAEAKTPLPKAPAPPVAVAVVVPAATPAVSSDNPYDGTEKLAEAKKPLPKAPAPPVAVAVVVPAAVSDNPYDGTENPVAVAAAAPVAVSDNPYDGTEKLAEAKKPLPKASAPPVAVVVPAAVSDNPYDGTEKPVAVAAAAPVAVSDNPYDGTEKPVEAKAAPAKAPSAPLFVATNLEAPSDNPYDESDVARVAPTKISTAARVEEASDNPYDGTEQPAEAKAPAKQAPPTAVAAAVKPEAPSDNPYDGSEVAAVAPSKAAVPSAAVATKAEEASDNPYGDNDVASAAVQQPVAATATLPPAPLPASAGPAGDTSPAANTPPEPPKVATSAASGGPEALVPVSTLMSEDGLTPLGTDPYAIIRPRRRLPSLAVEPAPADHGEETSMQLPNRDGESGLLSVPDANTMPFGRGATVTEFGYARDSSGHDTAGPSLLGLGIGFGRLETGFSLREGGRAGDPTPSSLLLAGAVKFHVSDAVGLLPAFAVDAVVDRANDMPVGDLRVIASTPRRGLFRAAAYVGAELSPSSSSPVGPAGGLALALGSHALEGVVDGTYSPRGTDVGCALRILPTALIGFALTGDWLVEEQTFRVGVSIALLTPSLAPSSGPVSEPKMASAKPTSKDPPF